MVPFKFVGKIRCVTFLLISMPVFMGLSCKQKRIVLKSPPNYNFAEVFAHKLDTRIMEISGIVWDSRNDEFIANNDEAGKLFYLDKETKIIKREPYKFGSKGDYEDIALVKGEVYVLSSDATITKVVKDSTSPDQMIGAEVGKLDLKGTNDFESMYYDHTRNALVVICKNCDMDKGKNRVSAFAFYPDSIGFVNTPLYTIDLTQVDKLSPKKTSRLEPSAAAINPKTDKLFIVSSGSHQLAVTDLNGKVELVFALAQKLFPQPEGLTFKNNGDMYISNEGVNSKATLLRFIYKP